MVEMAVRAVSGSTEFQIILEGHGAEWSRQKWYGWNPHILGSSKHHPELPADASGHDNPKQFDLTALLSRDFGMLSSDDSRNLYISVNRGNTFPYAVLYGRIPFRRVNFVTFNKSI